jgi:hypothetical protein
MTCRLGEELPRLRQRLAVDDTGTSLTELVVGMFVMGIFMAIFTTTVVSMARTTTKVEAVASSADQVNNGFLALDKLVRYATAITPIGQGTGSSQDPNKDWYVELYSIDNSVAPAVETCTQLRVDVTSQKLQLRTWDPTRTATYSPTAPAWSVLASKILNGGAASGSTDQPFSTPPPLTAASTTFQRLTITLVAGTSGPSSTSTTRSSLTFTASNSIASDTGGNAGRCQQPLVGTLRP